MAVWIYWPQLARVDSVAEAEGDKDAICHITCSKPVSSGCIAGVSHKPFCLEGSAQHRCETPPQELGFPWKELVEVGSFIGPGMCTEGRMPFPSLFCFVLGSWP